MRFFDGVCSLSLMAIAIDVETALPYVVGVLFIGIGVVIVARVCGWLKEVPRCGGR